MPKASSESPEFKRRLGRHIAAALRNSGLQSNQLAAKLGVANGTVTDWKKGRSAPSAEHVVAIARATGESVSFLLSDALPKSQSLEKASRELAARIGARRSQLLLAVPDKRLLRELDALIGSAISEGVADIAPVRHKA
jgi:transcriptional regulator with XRE-family HTH domain